MKKILLLCVFSFLCDFALKQFNDELLSHHPQDQQKSIKIIKPRKDR